MGALCGKLRNTCEGDTSLAGEQCKDVFKATQNVPRPRLFYLLPLTHLKFSIHSHYSQEKPIAGQPEYQGLYSSLFGVVIIRSVEIFIDAGKLVKKVFPISDYNCKVFKNSQRCFYPPFM